MLVTNHRQEGRRREGKVNRDNTLMLKRRIHALSVITITSLLGPINLLKTGINQTNFQAQGQHVIPLPVFFLLITPFKLEIDLVFMTALLNEITITHKIVKPSQQMRI